MDLYKIVGPNGECLNGGSGQWSLPTDTEPGDWWTIDGQLSPCHNGLHVASAEQVPHWLPSRGRAFVVYRVETVGDIIDADGKYVVGKARLLPRSRPMPDMESVHAHNAAVQDAALVKRARAYQRAERLADKTIPPVWRTYLDRIGTILPASHPGRKYQEAFTAARAAILAAQQRADAVYARDIARGTIRADYMP